MAYFLLNLTEITSETMKVLIGSGREAGRELKPFDREDKMVPQEKVKQKWLS